MSEGGGTTRPDVEVSYHGSVVMVEPISQEAREWVEDNLSLEGWQWMGGAFAVEPRYLENLVEGMIGDGLTVG